MPALISSAASGKKAAPKGPVRRRPPPAQAPPPPPPPAAAETSTTETPDTTSAAPPSPPPTQVSPVQDVSQREKPTTQPLPTPVTQESAPASAAQPSSNFEPQIPDVVVVETQQDVGTALSKPVSTLDPELELEPEPELQSKPKARSQQEEPQKEHVTELEQELEQELELELEQELEQEQVAEQEQESVAPQSPPDVVETEADAPQPTTSASVQPPTPPLTQDVSQLQTPVPEQRPYISPYAPVVQSEDAPSFRPLEKIVIEPRIAPETATDSQDDTESQAHVQSSQQTAVARTTKRSTSKAAGKKRVRVEAPDSGKTEPAKRVKRSSARSNNRVQTVAQGEDPFATSPGTSPAGGADSARHELGLPEQTAPRRRRGLPKAKGKRTLKSSTTITNSDDEDETVRTPEGTEEDGVEAQQPALKKRKRTPKQPKARSKRGATGETSGGTGEQQPGEDEEDPELHGIDPSTLSMWNLSHQSIHGKRSERGKKMDEIDWEEVGQKRRAAAEAIVNQAGEQPAAGDVVPSVERPEGAAEDDEAGGKGEDEGNNAGNGNDNAPEADQSGVQFELDENGEIIANDASLEQTAGADARRQAEEAPVEEINDLTAQLNRTTWINSNRRDPVDRVPAWKWKSDPWSEDETDKFYDALRMFGTDFFIISKMFPPKTRRMIKSKFNREEKLDPQRIDDALTGKQPKRMSIDHYSRETGRDVSIFTKYEGVEHAQRVINESMKDKQDQMTTAAQQEMELAEQEAAEKAAEKAERGKQKKGERKTRGKSKQSKGGDAATGETAGAED